MADILDTNLLLKVLQSYNGIYAGCYLTLLLYGITSYQTLTYFQQGAKDPRTIRNLVRVPPLVEVQLTNTSTRIYTLDHRDVVVPSLAAPAATLYVITEFLHTILQDAAMNTPVYAILLSVFLADLVIAGSLCFLLWRERSQIPRSSSLIKTLIFYTITTGLFTTVIAAGTVMLKIFMKDTAAFMAPFLALSNTYTGGLLASLERREKLRSQSANSAGALSFPLEFYRTQGDESDTSLPAPTTKPDDLQIIVRQSQTQHTEVSSINFAPRAS
uniref:DUF6534 domain-containing protein n=1 Tax=Psilocybe cubensis TaxID=181762 RepID=A0A8H7Y9G1_PSICU